MWQILTTLLVSVFLTPHNFGMRFQDYYLAKVLVVSILVLFLNGNANANSNSKDAQDVNQANLTKQLKLWVAERLNIEPTKVEPSTSDRRFKVPYCLEKYRFSYPFSSKGTVKAICDEPAWEAFIRVRWTPKIKSYHGFIYTRDLRKGHILEESDIEMATTTRKAGNLANQAETIIGKSLAKNVNESDFIAIGHLRTTVEVFQITKLVYEGDYFSADNYIPIIVGTHTVTPQNRFKESLLKGAKANQSLDVGEIITRNSVDTPYRAFVAKNIIYKGSRISDKNVKLKQFWGKKRAGLVFDRKSIRLTQAGRTIREGDMLRTSDLKPAILVKRGEVVVLSINKGALVLSVSVEALGNGKKGDIVTFKNPESGETVRGKVTGTRTAKGL